MPTVQQWGRKESLDLAAARVSIHDRRILSRVVATGIFVYLRFQYGLSPLERTTFRTTFAAKRPASTPVSTYQMLYVSDGETGRPAVDADVQPGSTPNSAASHALDAYATSGKHGSYFLLRGSPRNIRTRRFTHGSLTGFIRQCSAVQIVHRRSCQRDSFDSAGSVFHSQRHQSGPSSFAMGAGSRGLCWSAPRRSYQAVGRERDRHHDQ